MPETKSASDGLNRLASLGVDGKGDLQSPVHLSTKIAAVLVFVAKLILERPPRNGLWLIDLGQSVRKPRVNVDIQCGTANRSQSSAINRYARAFE